MERPCINGNDRLAPRDRVDPMLHLYVVGEQVLLSSEFLHEIHYLREVSPELLGVSRSIKELAYCD